MSRTHPPEKAANSHSKNNSGNALRSTPRQDILRHLIERGPSSIKEVAIGLGRPADALYYHFRLLMRSGFIEEDETRQTKRRQEIVYSASERAADRENGLTAGHKTADSLLQAAGKEYKKAVEGREIAQLDKQLHLHATRRTAWLDENELNEIARLLSSIEDVLKDASRRDGDGLYSFTYVLTPLEEKPIRR